MSEENNGNKKEEQSALSPEIAACQTIDDLEGAHSRFEGSLNYFKGKATFQGKLLSAWRRDMKVRIPEGAGLPEIEKVLRTIAGKYHQASTMKHLSECVKIAAEVRCNNMFAEEVYKLTSKKASFVYKGKKQSVATSVAEAERQVKAHPEYQESVKQLAMAEIAFKMWIDILASLRFTAEIAKSMQMGQMSENKILGFDKSSTMITGRDIT